MKICPVGAEFFHADGRTNIMKLTVDFRNFAYAPTNLIAIPENRTTVLWLSSLWPNSPNLPRYPGQRDGILHPQLIDQTIISDFVWFYQYPKNSEPGGV
jgi:hypothetical protein